MSVSDLPRTPAPTRPGRQPPTRRPRREPSQFPYYLVLAVLAAFAVGPLVTLVFNALKDNASIGASPLTPPTDLSLDNFTQAWVQGDFATTMRNSVILCLGTVAGICVIAGLAAYALSHLDVPASGPVIGWLFLGSALPVQLFLVPLFFMWTHLGLTDSLFGLMIIYWATDAPFATLLLRSFLLKIPKDYQEAARLDGASELQIIARVMLPLAWPGFLTVGLIAGLWAWNEFFWAITFVHDPTLRPVSTSFLAFQDQYSTDLALTSAAALFMLGPVVILFLVLQRRFVAG
ncbi:MAG: carbohydrate ABC transporter permease, partial [Micromonosporaceae bacterium]